MVQQQMGEGGPDNTLSCKFSLLLLLEYLRLACLASCDHMRRLSHSIAISEF
jgi:hypothetical protein